MIEPIRQRILGFSFALIASVIISIPSLAQLKVTYPINRMVVQRDSVNQATVQIAGSFSEPLELIEARAFVRKTGQGITTGWSTLQANPVNGQFGGTINVSAGWYRIEVQGWRGGSVVAMDSVSRFGVGEVFAIVGHSNAQGSSCIIGGVDQCSTIAGASDERVVAVAIDQSTSTFQQGYLQTAETRYLPGLAFSQLLTHSGSSPFGQDAWLWGHMGDELVRQLNVPVLLYNAGFGGTTMQMTYWAAYDIPFQHSFVRYSIRMPYVNVRNLMNLYVPTTGIRAVLIQHGENDRNNPADSTYKYYTKVIDKMRTEFGKSKLGCIIALSSFVSMPYANVRQAQTQVINLPDYKAFLGPDLDSINTAADRPDGLHFSPSGQVNAGNRWAAAIARTWSSAKPFVAETQPMASLACAGSNQLTISQPPGYQTYDWSTGSTNQGITVGAGTYSVRIKNDQNRIYFPPAVVVPTTVQPAMPTISTDNGTWNICRSTGLVLSSSYTGLNNWSTGQSSSSIVVTTQGTYTLQAQHPVYGCLSSVVSQTIGRAPVDVGMSIVASRHAVAVNDTVRFRLLVQNKSGCDAGGVTILSRLPPNVSVVSATSLLSVGTNAVSGTIPAILAGATVSPYYVARLTAAGIYRTTAEVTATTNVDLNATPNNGTANGEDDEALADIRTIDGATSVYESPNPNQGQLPAVQSSQPAPDPSKVDLSIQLQVNRQTVVVNQPVMITITVSNRGGLAATNVVVRDSLPTGMQFISSGSGMSAAGAIVSATIGQISAGQSVSLSFTATVTSQGMFTNQAQIMSMSTNETDSDSVPGNGYTNGEDDQASLTVRTTG